MRTKGGKWKDSRPNLAVLVAIFGCCCAFVDAINFGGIFDAQELTEVTYDPELVSDPLWFAPEFDASKLTSGNIEQVSKELVDKYPKVDGEKYMIVTSKTGQKFACNLPERKKDNAEVAAPKSSKNPKYYGDLIAASFYVNDCIGMKNGWWRYELCRGKFLQQTHGTKGEDGYMQNSLGMFTGKFAMPSFQASATDRLLYVEELYDGGTLCDLPDRKIARKTVVRYECDPSLASQEAVIRSLTEPMSCEYLLVVKVGSLCSVPEFLPPNQLNSLEIDCHPYLNADRLRQYLRNELDKKHKRKYLEDSMKRANHEIRRVQRRRVAIRRTEMFRDRSAKASRVRLDNEFRAAMFDQVSLGVQLKTGKAPEAEAQNAIWALMTMVDFPDVLLYMEYESLDDELRGNLWYYFHDASWPKGDYPKDVVYVQVMNRYYREVLRTIALGDFKLYRHRWRQLQTSDPNVVHQNLIVSNADIGFRIMDGVPKPWRHVVLSVMGDAADEAGGFLDVVHGDGGDSLPHDYTPFGGSGFVAGPVCQDIFGWLLVETFLSELVSEMDAIYAKRGVSSFLADDVRIFDVVDVDADERLVFRKDSATTRNLLEANFRAMLAPIYWIAQMRFADSEGENPVPLPGEHSEGFLMKLCNDGAEMSRILAQAAIYVLQREMDRKKSAVTGGSNLTHVTLKEFASAWKLGIREKLGDVYAQTKNAARNDFEREMLLGSGYQADLEARKYVWDVLRSEWVDAIYEQDEKKRREGASMRKLLEELSGARGAAVSSYEMPFQTLGVGGMGGFADADGQPASASEQKLSHLEREMSSEGLDAPPELRFDDVKKVFDVLEKAGISLNDVDLQMDVLDQEGSNLLDHEDAEVRMAARQLLDQAMELQAEQKRIAQRQQAYASVVDVDDESKKKKKNAADGPANPVKGAAKAEF